MKMRTRRILLAALAVAIGVPFVAGIAATFLVYALNPLVLGGPQRITGAILSAGQRREDLLHVPRRYDRARPLPLVICLHGAMLWPSTQQKISGWDELADREGFLVVYPAGPTMHPLPFLPALPVWPMRPAARLDADVRFISDLIDMLERRYGVDPARIYVSGFSNGGGMAFALSCALATRVAAVGAVAAAQVLPGSWCRGSRPVPMIAFHGTADRLVPYGGSGPSRLTPRPFPGVRVWAGSWAGRNRCAPQPAESVAAPGVTRLAYAGCAGGADVVLYTVEGGGHTWPGGDAMPAWLVGKTTQVVDATVETWAFFRAHPLPSRPLGNTASR